ncbi:phage major capsid protein [Corallococcus sp. H22C18031201]|uniref:family 3 encapsulin nanocompartment shell protein n=1 Tax=Citreicoccus inhibens TaxID=2849499 RepID=UPI000E72B0B4|nr:family 3 encapsulin nanocompartment shell protein [Citreicoccus inhibens]MBU8898138.1 phage major capsid protein [Citreicoccus inhibens]RJS18023.1 phage major capsid protein [Corallococcus sp. H22C18031201]
MSSLVTTADVSPGRAFAEACHQQGAQASVSFNTTITDAFPGFKRRPRIAVRGMFKVARAEKDPVPYWYETHPRTAPTVKVEDVELRPEAAFEFHQDQMALKPTTAWIQVPRPLLEDREALAQFIDFRLLVRLNTAENQALCIGKGGERVRGLLETPGIRRLPPRKTPVASLLAACAEVEQMGGSADGIIINSLDFYAHLVGQNGLLGDLASMGVRICRTRMVSPGTVIVGDFTAAATLFDSGRSVIRFAQPPPGIFPREGLAAYGEVYTALTVHLPTHFFVTALV